ncbi:MAG: hypothetical protein ACRDDY_06250 [Clostridium sp.]|uniref:hypothetical protein n=1 Tax=Clostridium sp. TaxID=1506 RepID=UPI003EE5229E
MRIKKSVGGNIVTAKLNEELITTKSCNLPDRVNTIAISGFFVKNEDIKDIYVSINGGSKLLLKQGELFATGDYTDVISCIVMTDESIVRWGGLR